MQKILSYARFLNLLKTFHPMTVGLLVTNVYGHILVDTRLKSGLNSQMLNWNQSGRKTRFETCF